MTPDATRAVEAAVEDVAAGSIVAVDEVPTVPIWHFGTQRLRVVSAAAVARYGAGRRVRRVVEAPVPTPGGVRLAFGYLSADGREHLAIVRGSVRGADDVVVTVCPQCTTGHALRSTACGCGEHLERALDALGRHERGIVVHLGLETDRCLEALGRGESACAEHRRRCAADPIALAIVADLAPASTRPLDPPGEPSVPGRLPVAAG